LSTGDLFRQVHAFEARPFARLREQAVEIELALGIVGDHPVRSALGANLASQRPCIDTAKADAAVRAQPLIEALHRPEIARIGDRIADDAAERMRIVGLQILVIGTDVADVREGESDDLRRIGGIGHHLLVAGHRGVEADLADRLAFGAETVTSNDGAVGQNQYARRSLGRLVRSGDCHLAKSPEIGLVKRPVR
jgi:hypothetical protein